MIRDSADFGNIGGNDAGLPALRPRNHGIGHGDDRPPFGMLTDRALTCTIAPVASAEHFRNAHDDDEIYAVDCVGRRFRAARSPGFDRHVSGHAPLRPGAVVQRVATVAELFEGKRKNRCSDSGSAGRDDRT